VDSVIQVYNVPVTAPSRHTAACRLGHLVWRPGSQQLFIDVALKDQVRILPARRRQIVPLAQADHVRAGGGHWIQVRTFLDEENSGDPRDCRENGLVTRLSPAPILVLVEESGPRVEQLVDVRSFTNERTEEMDRSRREAVEQSPPYSGLFRGEA